jgi:hypothetical protein
LPDATERRSEQSIDTKTGEELRNSRRLTPASLREGRIEAPLHPRCSIPLCFAVTDEIPGLNLHEFPSRE